MRILGRRPAHPSPLIELRAPVSGTIVEQNVAGFEGIKSLDNTPNLFTIADLSRCGWCATFLKMISAKMSSGRCGRDSSERVSRPRISRQSGGYFPRARSQYPFRQSPHRAGEFPTARCVPACSPVATFRSRKLTDRVVVPATAIMRLQDKDWVFRKEGDNRFRRVEVHADGVAR